LLYDYFKPPHVGTNGQQQHMPMPVWRLLTISSMIGYGRNAGKVKLESDFRQACDTEGQLEMRASE
jgi:hypothetical protein